MNTHTIRLLKSNFVSFFSEYIMNEAAQDLLRWAEKVIKKAKADVEDPTLVTAGLTDLQQRLESHQRDCQDFDHFADVANTIKVC